MARSLIAIVLAFVATTIIAKENTPEGMPFGRIEDADVNRLQAFAQKSGFDMKAEIARVYCCDKRIDEAALERVLMFSRHFNTLDKNARTYGQIIYSSVLRIGEVNGVDYYAKILNRQPADVQQRVRDFLYYPDWHIHRDHAREFYNRVYPWLYPKSYQFGRGDPVFAKEL